jgi:hypothetical protein
MNNSWILLLYGLPTKQNAGRVQLWRKLKKFGALALKTSGYVLPDEPVHFERFQWLSTQIRDAGGDATLIRVSEIEGMPHEKVVQLFNEARAADYIALHTDVTELIRANRKKLSDEFLGALEKQKERLVGIRQIDYFACPKVQDVEMLLREAEALLHRKTSERPRIFKKDFVGRKWLTRPRPEGDRVASAWLIKRHIDAKAEFVFDANPAAFPKAVPFDMFDVEFSHHGEDCTFETLLKRFQLEDKTLHILGEMVHDADLEDEKFKRTEMIGLDRVFKGFAQMKLSDQDILVRGFELMDALYAATKR